MNEKQKTPKLIFAAPKDAPLLDELLGSEARETLKRLGWHLDVPDCSMQDRGIPWCDILRGYEGVITCWASPRLDDQTLAPDCRIRIAGHAAGSVADFVSPALYGRGIKVTTANDAMAQAVADWCLTMTLIGLRRLLDYAAFGGATPLRWEKREQSLFVQDAKIGIWGFGAVASHFVRMLEPLKPAEILVHDDYLRESTAASLGIRKTGFEEVFTKPDVILLLQSLTRDSAGKVGAEELALIRDGAVLINCGRAGLVREEALLHELEKGRFTAILDVYHQEPLPQNSPLHRMPNVLLTPHNAGRPSWGKFVPFVLEEFERFFSGQALQYEISYERAMRMTTRDVGGDKG